MTGTDWAYAVLVDIAREGCTREYLKSHAQQFTRETLNACVGMACSDIDWGKKRTRYAYEKVRDVCMELTQ